MQDAVAVIGRALIAQPRVRLARDLGGELSAKPRLADAGLAREQDDLAGAGPGLVQAVAQQGALRHPADEVGEPAPRRLEPAFGYGDVLDREGLDRLGKALRCLPAEVGGVLRLRTGRCGGRRRCLGGAQSGYGSKETLAVPERHAELLEID